MISRIGLCHLKAWQSEDGSMLVVLVVFAHGEWLFCKAILYEAFHYEEGLGGVCLDLSTTWLRRWVRLGVHQSFSTPGLWQGREQAADLRDANRLSYSFWMTAWHWVSVQWHVCWHTKALRGEGTESISSLSRFAYCCKWTSLSFSQRNRACW